MKRWEYAIAVEEYDREWTLWIQGQVSVKDKPAQPIRSFDSDVSMFNYMSQDGWELVTSATHKDQLVRLFFKRRMK